MESKIQMIIDEAHERVRALLIEMRIDIEKMNANAKSDGKQQGIDQTRVVFQKLEFLQATLKDEIALESRKIAFEIASAFLRAEVNEFPDSVVRVAQEILSSMPDAKHVYCRVNPQDVEILKENKDRLINILDQAKDIDIRSDKQVEQGGLLVQTEFGVIDAQLTTQLEELSLALGAGV